MCLENFVENLAKKSILISTGFILKTNVRNELKEEISERLGIREANNIGKYLGFPLKYRRVLRNPYNFIVERVMNKLAGWKANYLSFAGLAVLIKLVMSIIPNHVMQGAVLLVHVCEKLDKIN